MAVRRRTRAIRAVWAPSRIRRILRRRAVWMAVGLSCLAGAGIVVRHQVVELEGERRAWGTSETALVVVEPIAVGQPVAPSVATRLLPAATIPDTALRTVAPTDLARVALYEGEILLAGRVTGSPDGRLPNGAVALTLAISGRAPLVGEGDLVDLWVVDSVPLSSRRVAERVVVLARSDDDLTVAIPADRIGEAAVAAMRPVTVVLVG